MASPENEHATVNGEFVDTPRLSVYRRGKERIVGIHLHGVVTFVELEGGYAARLAAVLAPEVDPGPTSSETARRLGIHDGGEDG